MSNETSSRYSELMDSLNRAGQIETSPDADGKDVIDLVKASIANAPTAIPVRDCPRLSRAARMFNPGLTVAGGPTGNKKSWFAQFICMVLWLNKTSFAYLPLESNRAFYLRRMTCLLTGNFDALLTSEDCPDAPVRAGAAVESVRPQLTEIARGIWENPSLPNADGTGADVTPTFVLGWLKVRFEKGKRVAIVDPLAMLDFSSARDQWQAENHFIRALVNLTARYQTTVILVAHTTKKLDGKPLEVGDLQGGASISRNAESVVLVQSHEDKNSTISRPGGQSETLMHNMTLTCAKSRNAEAGLRIAYNFGRPGARFEELGIIRKG